METAGNRQLSQSAKQLFDTNNHDAGIGQRGVRSHTTILFILQVFIILSTSGMFAMTPFVSTPVVSLDGKLNCPVISEDGGTVYLQLTVTAPTVLRETDRKPMNLSIVIDRSGSMSDQHKMEYSKRAFAVLIDQLKPDDILSLVIYDDVVDVLRRAHRVGRDKHSIVRMLDEISPRGSTNLGGGMTEGFRQAEKFAGKNYVNRVILLSDGLANTGITDPHELQRTARSFRNRSISITTMGVGLDYNENLMMGISESGGGNYYFIEHPNALASIIRNEFDLVTSVLAQNASIVLTLGNDVHLSDVVGNEFRQDRTKHIIPVGDLHSGEIREFTVEIVIPPGKGKKLAASGELRYESTMLIGSFPTFSATVKYSDDLAEVERNRDIGAQAKADIALSSRIVENAMRAMDAGDRQEAEEQLNEAKNLISQSPAAAASGAGGESVRSQMNRIESFQKTAKEESDARRAKKSIQYENYKIRKNK